MWYQTSGKKCRRITGLAHIKHVKTNMLESTTMVCYLSVASNTYLLPSICSITNDGQVSLHWLWLVTQNAVAWAFVASLWHKSEEELILSIMRYVQTGFKAKSHLLT